MGVTTSEPAIRAKATRELSSRFHPILVTGTAGVTHGGDEIDLIHIGPPRAVLHQIYRSRHR
jgi:hypothetical protein